VNVSLWLKKKWFAGEPAEIATVGCCLRGGRPAQ